MLNQLIDKIQLVDKFSTKDIDLIAEYLKEESIAKNEHFLSIGEISRQVAFIGTGLAMHYRLQDGMEIPIDLLPKVNGLHISVALAKLLHQMWE